MTDGPMGALRADSAGSNRIRLTPFKDAGRMCAVMEKKFERIEPAGPTR